MPYFHSRIWNNGILLNRGSNHHLYFNRGNTGAKGQHLTYSRPIWRISPKFTSQTVAWNAEWTLGTWPVCQYLSTSHTCGCQRSHLCL